MIADTSFLIDLLRNNTDAINFYKLHEDVFISTTVITIFELSQVSGVEYEKVMNLVKDLEIYNFHTGESVVAAKITEYCKKNGITIDEADSMIAAIALSLNMPVVTRNVKHFSRVPELQVLTY